MNIKTWINKNGDKILIKNMTTQYIKNCIKAIEEERIQIGETIDLGYTGDGEGDGIIYDFIDHSKEYIQALERELEIRKDN